MVRSGGIPVHLETMEPGATYCIKAQTSVKAIGRQSAFSQAECVNVQGKGGLSILWSPGQVTAPLVDTRLPVGSFGSESPLGLSDLPPRVGGFLW